MKSFLFKLLPNIVQQFFIWKNEIKNEQEIDLDTEFDKFLSQVLEHRYRNVFAVININKNTLTLHKNKVIIFQTYHDALVWYTNKVSASDLNKYKICRIDFSFNIIKVHNL